MEKKKNKKQKPPIYTQKKTGLFARFFKTLLRVVYGKYTFIYHYEEPSKASVFVSNHTSHVAPLVFQYQSPKNVRTWGNSKFFTKEDCRTHLRSDMCKDNSFKSKFLSFLIQVLAPFVVWVYKKHANSIPVYFDFNIYKTFKMSSETLTNGSSVIIYPEKAYNEFNGVLSGFATGFAYVAQAHYKLTEECINFYPVYFAQTLKEVHFGKPITYNPEVPMEEQSITISDYIFNQIMELYSALPPHKVIPMYAVTKKRKMEEKEQKRLAKQEKRKK